MATAREYRTRMAQFATMRLLDVWYHTVDVGMLLAIAQRARAARRTAKQAQHRDHLRAQAKLTGVIDGSHRIRHAPPLLVRVDDAPAARGEIDSVLDHYLNSLSEEHRHLVAGIA
jgi:uncharacterized protein DUF2252